MLHYRRHRKRRYFLFGLRHVEFGNLDQVFEVDKLKRNEDGITWSVEGIQLKLPTSHSIPLSKSRRSQSGHRCKRLRKSRTRRASRRSLRLSGPGPHSSCSGFLLGRWCEGVDLGDLLELNEIFLSVAGEPASYPAIGQELGDIATRHRQM